MQGTPSACGLHSPEALNGEFGGRWGLGKLNATERSQPPTPVPSGRKLTAATRLSIAFECPKQMMMSSLTSIGSTDNNGIAILPW